MCTYKGLRVCLPVRPEKTCSEECPSYIRTTRTYKGLRVCLPIRPEKTCSEECRSYARPTRQRKAALSLILIFKPESSVTVTLQTLVFVLARESVLIWLSF